MGPQAVTTERRTQGERRDEAEHRLFKAAVAMVAERGIERVTLADIGEAAGYSRGLPAHYFGSKSGMIAALAERLVEGFGDALARAEPSVPGLDQLLGAIRFYFDSAARDPVTTRALFVLLGEGLNNPQVQGRIAHLNAEGARHLQAQIAAAIRTGEARASINAEAEALLIMGQLRGVVGLWLLSPDTVNLPAVRDTMIAAVRRNLTL